MPSAVFIASALPDALQDGVDAEASRELAYPASRLLASLAHNVGRPKLSRQQGASLVAPHDNDLLGAETSGCDDPA